MIVRKNKTYEVNSGFPNSNPCAEEEAFVVDETTQEGKKLAVRIEKAYPFYDFILDENGNLVDIYEYPDIKFSVDKTTITTMETATITITEPTEVVAVIDGQEYTVSNGIIEYSNENIGIHEIVLKAEKYRDAVIRIEVIE